MSGRQASKAYRAWMLTLLVLACAFSFVDRIIINVVGQAVITDLALSDLQFGLLGGMAFAIFFTAFGLPIARLADRGRRVSVLALSIAVWSLMTMLCGVAQNYIQLLTFRMGVGIGEAGGTPASHSLISAYYPPGRRASAIGIYFLGVPLGTLLGSLIGGWVGAAFGWRQALLWAGAPGLLLALVVWLTVREPAHEDADTRDAVVTPPLSSVLARVVRVPSLRNLMIGCTLVTMAANGISTFAPAFFVRGFGMALADVGLAFGLVMGVSGLIGVLAGGFGADVAARRDLRWYAWLPAGGVLLSAPFYAAGYSQATAAVGLPLILLGAISLATYVAPVFGVAQNLVEPRMRASMSAILLLAMNLMGQGVGPTVMGHASDVLAARQFGDGYRERCLTSSSPTRPSAECAAASAAGLRQTLVGTSLLLPAGAAFFLLAARTIRRDFATSGTLE